MVVFRTIVFIKIVVSLTIVNDEPSLTIVNDEPLLTIVNEERKPTSKKYQEVLASPPTTF